MKHQNYTIILIIIFFAGFINERSWALEKDYFFKYQANSPTVILDLKDDQALVVYTRVKSSDKFEKVKMEGLKSYFEINKTRRDGVFSNHDDLIYFRPADGNIEKEEYVIGIKVDADKVRVANQGFRVSNKALIDNPKRAYNASSLPLKEWIEIQSKYSTAVLPKFPFSSRGGTLLWLTFMEAAKGPWIEYILEIAIQVNLIPPEKFAVINY